MKLSERRYASESCDKCHSCKQSPVIVRKAFSSQCPSFDFGRFHSYSANGKVAMGYALDEGKISYSPEFAKSVYSCTMCGACQSACGWNHSHVDPLETLYALRERMVDDGQSPSAHQAMISNLRNHGNLNGKLREQRMQWAAGLNVPLASKTAPAQVLVHVGASMAYGAPEEARAIVQLLRAAGVSFAVLGESEAEFGAASYDLGHPNLAREMGEAALRAAAEVGAQTLVLCGADAISAIRWVHPQIGVPAPSMRCVHITEYLVELQTQGRLTFAAPVSENIAYHDACKLGRLAEPYQPWHGQIVVKDNIVDLYDPPNPVRAGNDGIYEAPRALLKAAGVQIVEMMRKGPLAYCCGAAGGGKETVPGFGDASAHECLSEASATDARSMTTACASCLSHMSGKSDTSVRGFFSLLASALGANSTTKETV